MGQYIEVSPDEARKLILQDSSVANFLKIGLFNKELIKYLNSMDISVAGRHYNKLFLHEDAQSLAYRIAGSHLKISYGSGFGGSRKRSRRIYPGSCIYYIDYFDKFNRGMARIIYEVLDSKVKSNPVSILWELQQGKRKLGDFYSLRSSSTGHYNEICRHAKKLSSSSLGLISFDGNNLGLTNTSKKIFSPEIKKIWEELKKWEFRIDVW